MYLFYEPITGIYSLVYSVDDKNSKNIRNVIADVIRQLVSIYEKSAGKSITTT